MLLATLTALFPLLGFAHGNNPEVEAKVLPQSDSSFVRLFNEVKDNIATRKKYFQCDPLSPEQFAPYKTNVSVYIPSTYVRYHELQSDSFHFIVAVGGTSTIVFELNDSNIAAVATGHMMKKLADTNSPGYMQWLINPITLLCNYKKETD